MSPTIALQNFTKYCRSNWLTAVVSDLNSVVCRSRRLNTYEKENLINMDGKTFLTEDEAFKNLQKYFEEKGKHLNIHQLFLQDPERFQKYRYFISS